MLKRRKFASRWRWAGLLIAPLVLVSAGCATDASPGADDEKPMTVVKFGYQPALNAPVYFAKERDLFAEQGIDLQFIKFSSGPEIYSALRSNSVDIADFSTTSFVTGLATGVDIKTFGVIYDLGPSNILVAQPGLTVNSADDLRGLKVASVTGTSAYAGLLSYLSESDMTIDDIDYLNLKAPAIQAAFDHGDVDAAYIYAPISSVLQGTGGVAVTNNAEAGFDGYELFVARSAWLADNEDAAASILKAVDTAAGMLKDSANDVEAATAVEQWTGIDLEIVKSLLKSTPFPTLAEMTSDSSKYSVTSTGGVYKALKDSADLYLREGFIEPTDNLNDLLSSAVVSGPALKAVK